MAALAVTTSWSSARGSRAAPRVSAAGAVLSAVVLATPPSPPPTLTAETARGTFAEPLNVNTKLANGARVKLKTKGPVELITQRIVAQPGAMFGWQRHPGENINVVLQGTLTLYHDEDCANGVAYPAGSAFPTHPDHVHLARNVSETDTLTFFAPSFAPETTPPYRGARRRAAAPHRAVLNNTTGRKEDVGSAGARRQNMSVHSGPGPEVGSRDHLGQDERARSRATRTRTPRWRKRRVKKSFSQSHTRVLGFDPVTASLRLAGLAWPRVWRWAE
jgi:quercetin dioxygenase-like cupin family protein